MQNTKGISEQTLLMWRSEFGNVLSTVSDRKRAVAGAGGIIAYWQPELMSSTDYYPFGMQMEGRIFASNAYRWGFNGQEKDNEIYGSGKSYTAEYWQYDSRLGRRWNVDPVDKPWMSSYHAFSNKHVLNADPNGACDDCPKEAEELNMATEEGTVQQGQVWKDKSGKTFEFDQEIGGWLPAGTNPTDNTSPIEVGMEWLTGEGPRQHDFTSGDPFLEMLREHEHIGELKGKIGNALSTGSPLPSKPEDLNYSLAGTEGVPKYIRDYSTLATFGRTGNLAVTYLGSYSMTYKVTENDVQNRRARVQFYVHNTSTIESATHPPVIGYTPLWSEYIGKPLNRFFSTGPMSKTIQTFTWSETIKY